MTSPSETLADEQRQNESTNEVPGDLSSMRVSKDSTGSTDPMGVRGVPEAVSIELEAASATGIVHKDVIEQFRADFMAREVNVNARRQFNAMCNQALRSQPQGQAGEPCAWYAEAKSGINVYPYPDMPRTDEDSYGHGWDWKPLYAAAPPAAEGWVSVPTVKRATGRTIPDLTKREHVCEWQHIVSAAAPQKGRT